MALIQPLFLTIPTYDQSITVANKTSSIWYRFFQGTFTGQPTGAEINVTLTGSPFIYTAPTAGMLIIAGGTISKLSLNRTQDNALNTNESLIPMANGDQVSITYSVKPTTFTFMPS